MKERRMYPIICGLAMMLVLSPFSTGISHGAEAIKGVAPPKPIIPHYTYKWVGKPDPFKPFIDLGPKVKAMKKPAEKSAGLLPISPLQRLELSAIRVVGIAGDDRNRKAIVEDRQKKFYPIQVGTYIGTNNGMIKEILADRVIVEEKETVLGKIKLNLITMKIYTSEDEEKP